MSRFDFAGSGETFSNRDSKPRNTGPREDRGGRFNRDNEESRPSRFGNNDDSRPTGGRFNRDGDEARPSRFDDRPREDRPQREDRPPREDRGGRFNRDGDDSRPPRFEEKKPRANDTTTTEFSRDFFGTAEETNNNNNNNRSKKPTQQKKGEWTEVIAPVAKETKPAKKEKEVFEAPKAAGRFALMESDDEETPAPKQQQQQQQQTKQTKPEPQQQKPVEAKKPAAQPAAYQKEEAKQLEPMVLGRPRPQQDSDSKFSRRYPEDNYQQQQQKPKATPETSLSKADELFGTVKQKKQPQLQQAPSTTTLSQANSTGGATFSSMKQETSAGWTKDTSASAVASFGGKKEKNAPAAVATAPAAKSTSNSQLVKAVEGSVATVAFGQIKKSIQDIVPFPAVDNGKENFAAALAKSVSNLEYSYNDMITTLSKQFIDAYVRYGKKNSVENAVQLGVDVLHTIFVLATQKLLESNKKDDVLAFFNNYDTEKLALFVPYATMNLADGAEKKAKCIEFFKANGLVGCLSSADNGQESSTAAGALEQEVYAAVSTANDKAKAVAALTPKKQQIADALKANSMTFLTTVFEQYLANKVATANILAFLDGLFDLGLINFDIMDQWQTKETKPVKREMLFKIGGWIKNKQPQITSYYSDDEEEEDGF